MLLRRTQVRFPALTLWLTTIHTPFVEDPRSSLSAMGTRHTNSAYNLTFRQDTLKNKAVLGPSSLARFPPKCQTLGKVKPGASLHRSLS